MMNRDTLRLRLEEEDVAPMCYDLDGSPKDMALVLVQLISGWCVYYSERGGRFDERTFESEDEACSYMFDHLTSTDSTRRKVIEEHRRRTEG